MGARLPATGSAGIPTGTRASGLTLAFDDKKLIKALRDHKGDVGAEVGDALFHAKAKLFKRWYAAARRAGLRITARRGLVNYVLGVVKVGARPLSDYALRIVNYSRYFWTHERGKTITGRNKKLAVPLYDPAWIASNRYRKHRLFLAGGARGKGATGEVDLFVRRGRAFLGQRMWRKMGKRSHSEREGTGIAYRAVLKREVKIRPRLSFFATWRGLQPWAHTRLDMSLRRAAARFNTAKAA